MRKGKVMGKMMKDNPIILGSLGIAACLTMTAFLTGCDRPKAVNPDLVLGDTVPASVFEPRDSADGFEKNNDADSAGVFTIGEGTDGSSLQLISWPSGRDTAVVARAAHMEREGGQTFGVGAVCRVTFGEEGGRKVVSRLGGYETEPVEVKSEK